MDYSSHFEGRYDAEQYLTHTLVPAISEHIHLFKTPKQKQDEYIVISQDWLGDSVFQSYALERDVVDHLASIGIPPVILYDTVVGNKVVQAKVNTFKQWRRSPVTQTDRLTGLCYLPGEPSIVQRQFNTYLDVSVAPLPGVENSEMLDHVHDNLCNKNTEYYTYLMNWLAHMIQRPQIRPMTGIAIIGGQGTGKGIFIEFLKRMMGGSRNVNTTASADDTKGFNYALGNKLLVVFDEATFSGDRRQSDFMKKLVTEPRIRIEQKGIDAYEVDNFARVMITSNNMQSAVPATIGARRWLIIECLNDLSQTELAAFAQRMEDPQHVAGFKQRLLDLDISNFDTTKMPQQNTGFHTKLHNHYKEDPIYAFLCEWISAPMLTLHRMRVGTSDDHTAEWDERLEWNTEVLFSTFYAIFKEACVSSFGQAPGPNRMRDLLAPYDIKIQAGTGNIRRVHLPEARIVLSTLEKSARFDLLVTPEQREYIATFENFRNATERTMYREGKLHEPKSSNAQLEELAKKVLERKPVEGWFPPEPVSAEQPWFIDGGIPWVEMPMTHMDDIDNDEYITKVEHRPLKIAVLKPGARLHWELNEGVGPGEAMSICKALTQAFVEVHVFTTLQVDDVLHSSIRWHNIEADKKSASFDAVLVINGKVQPGAKHQPELQYEFINSFDGPVFYALCDPELPLLNVGACKITRGDITVLTQALDVTRMRAIWEDTADAVPIKAVQHIPFERIPMCFKLWKAKAAAVHLIYGGSDRGGRRVQKLHDWYFGLPPDIHAEVFGKITPQDFHAKNLSTTERRPPMFSQAVPYGQLSEKLGSSVAHLAIGDDSYEFLDLVPTRVYEAIAAGCVTFIDSTLDRARRVYKPGSICDMLYVSSQEQLIERFRLLRDDLTLRELVINSQIEQARRHPPVARLLIAAIAKEVHRTLPELVEAAKS